MKKSKCKHSASLRTVSAILVALMLVCSLPITAFATDATGQQFTIIEDHLGNTLSTDPAVEKVDSLPDACFEDDLAPVMSRSLGEPISKGSFTANEYDDLTIATPTEAAGGTVVWSTSSSLRATVTSTTGGAYVELKTAGLAIIYATVTFPNNTQERYAYNIMIEISNGVYKFQNKVTDLYIELPGGDISSGTEYIQWSLEYNRNSQFKITSTGSGIYTIRSMAANTVGMRKSSSNMLENAYIGTSNDRDDIDDASLWLISSDSSGYYVYNYDGANGRYTITPTGTTSGYDSKFTLTYSTGALNQYWNLIRQSSNQHGVDIRYMPEIIEAGKTYALIATVYSSYPNENGGGTFTWSVACDGNIAYISNGNRLACGAAGPIIINVSYTSSTYSRTWSSSYNAGIVLPVSGYELDYDPSLWDGDVERNSNCYAYAINNQVVPPSDNILWYKQQPGEWAGIDSFYLTEPSIYNAVSADYDRYNSMFGTVLTFQRIGRFEVCPAGTYKVALVSQPNYILFADYHWYRQDSDGLWSHKQGLSPVTRTDNAGDLIYNPENADRGTYTEFLGFYAVSPWNGMVDQSGTVRYYFNNEFFDTYEELEDYIESMQMWRSTLNANIYNSVSHNKYEKGLME